MRILLFSFLFCCCCLSGLKAQDHKADNPHEGFQTFEMPYGDSVIVMKQYFMVFLKAGPNRNQSEEEAAELQKAHLAHLSKLAENKKTCITGPFGDDGETRGIVIYNTPTKEEAEKLANEDPAVKAGRLVVEVRPIWLAVGSKLF